MKAVKPQTGSYEIPVELTMGRERLNWVSEMFGEYGYRWTLSKGGYVFRYEDDAIQFALRWK